MSKGQEALKEHIINLKSLGFTRCEEWLDLIVIEKELKALEIIKKSVVEMSNTKVLMSEYYRVVLALDQKEYDLLKEVLNA